MTGIRSCQPSAMSRPLAAVFQNSAAFEANLSGQPSQDRNANQESRQALPNTGTWLPGNRRLTACNETGPESWLLALSVGLPDGMGDALRYQLCLGGNFCRSQPRWGNARPCFVSPRAFTSDAAGNS